MICPRMTDRILRRTDSKIDWGREMKRNNRGARTIVVNDMGTRGERSYG
jgi:hypothetical protein